MFLYPAILATGGTLFFLLPGSRYLTHNENLFKLVLLSSAILLWLLWYQAKHKQTRAVVARIAGVQTLFGFATALVLASCGMVLEALWQKQDFLFHNLSPLLFWTACVISLAAATIEELIFRGLLLGLLLRWQPDFKSWPVLAVITQAALFAWLHVVENSSTPLLDSLSIWTGAMILGATVVYSGRLWLAIGLHTGWNVVQYIAYGVQKPNLDYLPGLFSTALASQVWVTVNWVLIGLALLWLRHRKVLCLLPQPTHEEITRQ